MNRFIHRYKMVSAKDDSLPTNTEVCEADADEVVESRLNPEVRSTRSNILNVFDRKTYELTLPVVSNLKHTKEP
jgi:hypothetical protein